MTIGEEIIVLKIRLLSIDVQYLGNIFKGISHSRMFRNLDLRMI